MARSRWLVVIGAVVVVVVAVVAWLAGGRGGRDSSASSTASPTASPTASLAPTPTETPTADLEQADSDPRAQALTAVLLASDVPPAPPGSEVEDFSGPVAVDPVEAPNVQVESCSILIPTDVPGPDEPDAKAGAETTFTSGVAQVDQYVIVYRDEAAAQTALGRHRALAEDCEAALQARVTQDSLGAAATVSGAPAGVEGYRVEVRFDYPQGSSDEYSGVFRAGSMLAFTRTSETESGGESLDAGWVDQLMTSAASKLVEASNS